SMKTLIGPLFLFLWLQLDCMSRGEEVKQHPSFLSVWEGDSFVINCTYTDSASTYFFWYKQQPGKGLQLLIYTLSSMDKKQEQRLTATFDKTTKQSSFYITEPQPADSATYLCAANTQQGPITCFLYPNSANNSRSQQNCWLH
uniref:T cell receptor alpha variable 5 n=1 Tax=Lynx canadensis TaxID=61383 RepID=A0A667GBK2_LYNCA